MSWTHLLETCGLVKQDPASTPPRLLTCVLKWVSDQYFYPQTFFPPNYQSFYNVKDVVMIGCRVTTVSNENGGWTEFSQQPRHRATV